MPSSDQKTVPISQILVPGDQNVRSDLPHVKDLAARIESRGLLQPLVVSNGGTDKQPFILIAGFRRMAALKMLGWKEVPVTFRSYGAKSAGTPIQRLVDNIAENEDREDVSPLDLAERAHQLVTGTYPVLPGEEAKPLDKKEVAQMLGWSVSHLSNLVRVFTNLDADVSKACRKSEVPLRTMLVWAGIEGKGKTPEDVAADRAEKQTAAFEEWAKAKAALSGEGRVRQKRKSKKSDDEQTSSGVLSERKKCAEFGGVRYNVAQYLDVLTAKAEGANKEEATKLAGAIETLEFLTGRKKKPALVVAADFKLIAKEEEEVEEKDAEE